MAQKFTLLGMSAGRTIVRFEDGSEKKLTAEELAELKGGKAVKKLSDEKLIATIEKDLVAVTAERDEFAHQLGKIQVELKAKADAIAELEASAKKKDAELAELASAKAALENTVRNLKAELAEAAKPKAPAKKAPAKKKTEKK